MPSIDSLIFLGSSRFRKQLHSQKQSHQEALNTEPQCLAEEVSAGRLKYCHMPALFAKPSQAFAAAWSQSKDLGQDGCFSWPGNVVVIVLSVCMSRIWNSK